MISPLNKYLNTLDSVVCIYMGFNIYVLFTIYFSIGMEAEGL